MCETKKPGETTAVSSDIQQLLTGTMTQQKAEEIYAFGKEAVILALLTQYALLIKANNENAQGQPAPSTPSGSIPTYLKLTVKKRKRKPGRPEGHKGEHRNVPEPDKTVQLQLELCPECGGPLSECRAKSTRRKRIVEDIPEGIKTETTQYEMPTCLASELPKNLFAESAQRPARQYHRKPITDLDRMAALQFRQHAQSGYRILPGIGLRSIKNCVGSSWTRLRFVATNAKRLTLKCIHVVAPCLNRAWTR